MKLGIITDEVNRDFESALQTIRDKGYSYVEIHSVFGKTVETCTLEEAHTIRELLDQYGMMCSNLCSTFFFLAPLYPDDVVTMFSDTFAHIKGTPEKHLEYLANACEVAKIIGTNKIRVFPFRFPDNKIPPFGGKEDQEMMVKYLKEAAEIVAKYDCMLVLENCPYSHSPKGKMTYDLIREVNDEHLRLLWDPANSYRAVRTNVPEKYLYDSLMEELELIYPYIEHIHIKDYHYDPFVQPKPFLHRPIYDGDLPIDEMIRYLSQHDYPHTISLEPEVDEKGCLLCMERLKEHIGQIEIRV